MEERTIRRKYINTIIIVAMILLVATFLYKPIETAILKCLYPCKYSEYVEKYAKQYNVDHLLIYSIIKAESNFQPQSTSNSGAKGLMQLMETTADEVAQNTGMDYDIYNIEQNIMMGTKYFSDLMNNYNGNLYLSLTAYNAGMGNVAKWIESGIIEEDRKQYRKYSIQRNKQLCKENNQKLSNISKGIYVPVRDTPF